MQHKNKAHMEEIKDKLIDEYEEALMNGKFLEFLEKLNRQRNNFDDFMNSTHDDQLKEESWKQSLTKF